jgi:hypothetical protein
MIQGPRGVLDVCAERLSGIAAFAEFQRELANRCIEQPIAQAALLSARIGF